MKTDTYDIMQTIISKQPHVEQMPFPELLEYQDYCYRYRRKFGFLMYFVRQEFNYDMHKMFDKACKNLDKEILRRVDYIASIS